MKKGIFVVFEGIDGSGKSSVCKMVSTILSEKGHDVIVTAEPTNDEIGTIIRKDKVKDISNETEALLFVADRSQHTIKIKQWVADGNTVLCDRYYSSTLAYQAAPFNGVALDMDWLIALNEKVIIEPDITFLIDVSPEEGLKRVGKRGELSKFETIEYLKAVRNNYLEIAKKKGFRIIDATKPLDEVVKEVHGILKEKMER